VKNGWERQPLGDLCEILDSMRKPVTKKDRVAGDIPYYGATGIQDYVADHIFDEPLVLVGEDGAKWGAGENTAFAVSGKCWVNNHAHVLRPHRKTVVDNWLIYYLNATDLTEYVSGLTVPKLNQGNLRQIPIPVPPLAEQRRIVTILDEAIEGIAAVKAKAEQKRFCSTEANKQLAAQVFGALGDCPLAMLGDVCEKVVVGHVGTTSPYYRPNGIPFLRTQNLTAHGLSLEGLVYVCENFHKKLKKSQVRSGDVLLSRVVTDSVNCAVLPPDLDEANCANVVVVRPGKKMRAQYLAHYVRSRSAQQYLLHRRVGSAQLVVNTTVVKQWPIPVPSLEEQDRIIAAIEAGSSAFGVLSRNHAAKLDALDELKASLLHQAFTGAL
jgi:type I restriction enzyme S subunit